jgi:hypothetical protein
VSAAHARSCTCERCWRWPTTEAAKAEATGPALSAATLRETVALCHPDRHPPERRAAATRVTQELLDALALARSSAA